jgi:hypothetical protein
MMEQWNNGIMGKTEYRSQEKERNNGRNTAKT